MDTANPNKPNLAFDDVTAFYKHVDKLSDAEGKGALARPEFFIQTAIATHEGHVSPDRAAEVWGRFKKKSSNQLEGAGVVTADKSEKVRVSELRRVMIASELLSGPGSIKGFYELLQEAKPIIAKAKGDGTWRGNTQDAFVTLARAQIDVKDRPLTDDEITAALAPNGEKEKDRTEVASLDKLIKALKTHIEGTDDKEDGTPGKPSFPSDEASEAMRLLEERKAALEYSAAKGKKRGSK